MCHIWVPAQHLAKDPVDTKIHCAHVQRESVEVSWDTGFLGHLSGSAPATALTLGELPTGDKNLCLMGPGETDGLAGKVFATQVWGL